jgi:hypothetical protein
MPQDPVLDALIEAVSAEYEVFGELGQREDRSIAFLSRRHSTNALVALLLSPTRDGADGEYSLEVVDQLDARVPSAPQQCVKCLVSLRPWARYCTRCGHDASGVSASGLTGADDLRRLAEEAAGSKYEFLGEMPRAGGGGAVYFGRNRRTGQVAALRLELGTDLKASVSTTQTLVMHDSPPDDQPAVPNTKRRSGGVSVVMRPIAPETKSKTPIPTLTGNEPTTSLSAAEAAAILGVDAAAAPEEIRRRYEDMYSEYRVRETNAPTATLRAKYRASLASIEAAGRALLVP